MYTAHDFAIGDIVWWSFYQTNGLYKVNMGMVDDVYSDIVYIDYLTHKENRYVRPIHEKEWIPINDFETEQHWHKLPKGWTYNTRLYEIRYEDLPTIIVNFHDAASIKKAYDEGWLIKKKDTFNGEITDEIFGGQYRVVKRYSSMRAPEYTSIEPYRLCKKYEEAKAIVDAQNAEVYRIANLNDYDWSVEQIDKELARWQKLYGKTDTEVKAVRDWLLSRKNVEDIEVRLSGGNIEWKYWKKKRWSVPSV